MKHAKKFTYSKLAILLLFLLPLAILLTNCTKNNPESQNTNTNTAQNTPFKVSLVKTPDSIYNNLPIAPFLTGAGSLPSKFSLPIPTNLIVQDSQEACTSIATAEAKSIQDNYQLNIPFPQNQVTYSPSYLWDQVHIGSCATGGSYIYLNLNILKNQGICTLSELPYDGANINGCMNSISPSLMNSALPNKIASYSIISPITVAQIKQSIYSGNPVIVNLLVDSNFMYTMAVNPSYIWNSLAGLFIGFHACTFYGWDDSKNALELLNPWGDVWGNNGSGWVDYNFVEKGYDAYKLTNVFNEAYVMVNPTNVSGSKPSPNFSVSGNTTINQGQTVSFLDQSTNTPTSWSWTFPGGNPSTSATQNPTVTYNSSGSYNVTLSVGNSSGSNSITKTAYIQVNSTVRIPTANFAIIGSTTITAGSSVSFLDQSTNSPTNWYWTFSGGTPSSSRLQNPVVTYSTAGTYNVSLTVSNAAGTSSPLTQYGYIIVTPSSSSGCGSFTDSRDGTNYTTVQLGTQCWMVENLKYPSAHSVSYAGQTYYDWYSSDMTTIAPSGFHVPSDAEWQQLEEYLGMSPSDAASTGNRGTNQGTQMAVGGSSGLNLQYLGIYEGGPMIGYGSLGGFWTSTPYSGGAYARIISSGSPQVSRGALNIMAGYYFSIRCIKN